MTCRRSFVTHFHLQYECFMSSSGTFAGTMTLTVVFFLILHDGRMTGLRLALRPALPTGAASFNVQQESGLPPGFAVFSERKVSSLNSAICKTTVSLLYCF